MPKPKKLKRLVIGRVDGADMAKAGDLINLTVLQATDAAGNPVTPTMPPQWQSSNTAVAIITQTSADGMHAQVKVVGTTAGTSATITASADGVTSNGETVDVTAGVLTTIVIGLDLDPPF